MSEKKCSVEGCCLPVKARGLCSSHHQRWRVHGDAFSRELIHAYVGKLNEQEICAAYKRGENTVSIAKIDGRSHGTIRRILIKNGVRMRTPWEIRKPPKKCKVSGCTRRSICKGFCAIHYWRWKNKRKLEAPIASKQKPYPPGTLCSVSGCGREAECRGLCGTHYLRLWKRGTVTPERPIGRPTGKYTGNWKGGRFIGYAGYVNVLMREHPFCDYAGYCKEHRLVMEKKLGRYLTRQEIVHHKWKCEGGSGDKTDNRIENLMLFSSSAAHASHHKKLYKLHGKNAR